MQDTGPGNGKNAGWCEAGMPRVLAQLLPLGRLPGSLARLTLKKFLRFLNSQELFLRKANRDPLRLFSLRNLA